MEYKITTVKYEVREEPVASNSCVKFEVKYYASSDHLEKPEVVTIDFKVSTPEFVEVNQDGVITITLSRLAAFALIDSVRFAITQSSPVETRRL